MTDNSKLVLNGYMSLSPDERKEVREEIEKFEERDYLNKSRSREAFNESIKRIVGPTSSSICPSCGR